MGFQLTAIPLQNHDITKYECTWLLFEARHRKRRCIDLHIHTWSGELIVRLILEMLKPQCHFHKCSSGRRAVPQKLVSSVFLLLNHKKTNIHHHSSICVWIYFGVSSLPFMFCLSYFYPPVTEKALRLYAKYRSVPTRFGVTSSCWTVQFYRDQAVIASLQPTREIAVQCFSQEHDTKSRCRH